MLNLELNFSNLDVYKDFFFEKSISFLGTHNWVFPELKWTFWQWLTVCPRGREKPIP